MTQATLRRLKVIEDAQLGWGHSARKFFATTGIYSLVLSLPIFAFVGAIYAFFDSIHPSQFGWREAGVLGGAITADYAAKKLLGVRPSTFILLALGDSLRHLAKTASRHTEAGYKATEQRVADQTKEITKDLLEELTGTYLALAEELAKRATSREDAEILQKNLPFIAAELSKIGLNHSQVLTILNPLQSTVDLLLMPQKPH